MLGPVHAETGAAAGAPLGPTPVPLDRLARSNNAMSVFIWNNPSTTQRDLATLQVAGFGWQKSLFKWREMNPDSACTTSTSRIGW